MTLIEPIALSVLTGLGGIGAGMIHKSKSNKSMSGKKKTAIAATSALPYLAFPTILSSRYDKLARSSSKFKRGIAGGVAAALMAAPIAGGAFGYLIGRGKEPSNE